MSYDIVKSIKITEDKVLINCVSNNVYPHYFEEWESQSLSKILKEQGKDAVELEIFKHYEQGNFQRGSNKYVRALTVLKHLPEYTKFNWRLGGFGPENDIIQKNRESKDFDDLLVKTLKTYLPKEKYIVYKLYCGKICYLYKITKKFAKWTYERDKAKVFRYQTDAENIKNYFTSSNDWLVEKTK